MIEDTKTESGKRMVPMTPEVEACFRKILEARAKPKIEPLSVLRQARLTEGI